MKPTRERVVSVVRALVAELRAEEIPFIAGSIAYHAFVSLLPLLVLVLAALSTVGSPSETVFLDLAGGVLTHDASEALLRQLKATEITTGVSVVGGIVLLWGALRIFRGLDVAFSAIYETEARNSIPDQFADAAVVFVSFGLAVAVAWQLDGVFAAFGTGPGAWLLGRVALMCGVAVTFFPVYYVFPDADVSVAETLPGLGVAAVGLVALVSVFQFYAAAKAGGSSVIVGILALLTWLYFSGLVILVGAAVNAVLSNRSRDVDIEPVVGNHASTSHPTDRERLTASLREIAAIAEASDELVLITRDAEVRLPPPQRAMVETDEPLDVGGETVRLELRWLPRESTNQ